MKHGSRQSPAAIMFRRTFLFVAVVATVHFACAFLGFDGIIDIGTVYTDTKIGTLPPKYPSLSAVDVLATNRAMLAAELLRRLMPTGVFTVPPLDPYYRETLGPFKVLSYSPILEGSIGCTNAAITGLKDFQINGFELRQGYYDDAFRADVNITLPLIRFQAEFNGMLTLETIVGLPVTGSVSMTLQNVRLVGAVGGGPVVGKSGHRVLGLNSLVGTCNMGSVKAKLDFDQFLIKIWESSELFVTLGFYIFQDDIARAIAETLIYIANELLAGVTVEQARAYLNSGAGAAV